MQSEAHFTGDLRGVDFSCQPLPGAVFRKANLYRVSFAGADLRGAAFEECFAAETSFAGAQCGGLRAQRSNFFCGNFTGADLSAALLWNCVLARADLRGARLRQVTITLDCSSFEELRLDYSATAELAYLLRRARSRDAPGNMVGVSERDLQRLERVFSR
jgi:uncharacterized protein YjbI with pentapeptide repeats